MSLNRYAPKRDKNEGEIRKRFAHHGWHTEQLSGSGMPDLLAVTWHTRDSMNVPWRSMVLVDVKEPKGKVTPAQDKKWTALLEKGIPVYVARTESDVDAIAAGTAEPWRPAKPIAKSGYTPPRGPGVDAAKQADETLGIHGADFGSKLPRVIMTLGDVSVEVTGMTNEEIAEKAASLINSRCPACMYDPQSSCKHDGEEKGVALGLVPPRRLNQRPVDKIMAR